MPRTVSDEEWQYLQSRKTTADFVESVYNDPALNREAKALIKKKYPNLSIPDFDLENKIDSKFAEAENRRAQQQAANRQKRQQEEWNKKRAEVQKQYSFTDEGMKELEKVMVDKQIGDYEAGALYLASKKPKPVEAQFQSQYWQHNKKEGWDEITKDPEGWGRGQILGAVQRDMERMKNQG